MTNFIIAMTVLLCIVGISVVIWSIVDTRHKYYNNYLSRKGHN